MSLALLLAALAQQPQDPFEWFDTLGYPDLKQCPFVRVATGRSTKRPGRDAEPVFVEAFLLEDNGATFVVFGLDLEKHRLEKKAADPKEESVFYEKIDLAKSTQTRLAALKAPPREDEEPFGRFGQRFTDQTTLFVLARGCERQGHKEVARDLLEFAAKMPDRRRKEEAPEKSLKQQVSDDIANARTWQAVLEFGDLSVSRKQLLETFRGLHKLFPDSPHSVRTKETVALLEKMVREDDSHVAPKKPTSEMPVRERVAELVFQLRNQNGEQHSQPGSCDVFADPRGEGSPAHQLAKIGFDAVPQLIEVLEDDRLTRSVGFHRNFYFSHYVLCVGDVALAILERIAGRRFWEGKYTAASMVKDKEAKATKETVQTWWAEIQKKGEKQMLIEATERGDLNQAGRLLEKHPELALSALSKALRQSKDEWARGGLIQLLCKVPGDESTRFLLTELKEGPSLGTRITAALELVGRGRPEVLPALLEEWKKSATAPRDPGEDFFGSGSEAIVVGLMATGRPEAVRALGENLGKRPPGARIAALRGLAEDDEFFSLTRGEKPGRPPGLTADQEKEAARAAEDVLAAALDDLTVHEGMSMGRPGKSFSDPRICDIAAQILSTRWSKTYEFDISAPRRIRDRQIVEARNAWRKSRSLAPLPVPEAKGIEPLPAAQVDPLVDAVLRGDAGADEALLGKGVPALKGAQGRLDRVDKSHARRAALESATRRLGCTVADATIVPVPAKKDDVLAGMVAGLHGRSLTGEVLAAFLIKACKNLPEGTVGYRLTVERESDLAGVRVLVETVTERVARGSGIPGWQSVEKVRLGDEGVLDFGSSGRESYGVTPEGYKMLERPVALVLSSPATSAFSIRISRVLKD